jgi:cysteinyl-tRNA synthetase
MELRLYNSLTRKLEEFVPQDPNLVSMYTCGPTVYNYVTIGNFRTYVLGDILYRTLLHKKYNVKYVMNLTDVGHLSGDNEGDADVGEDRLETAAEKEGRSATDVADFYIKDFKEGIRKLNLLKPTKFTRATEYIDQQIDLVRVLENKGYTYQTSDGVYFDTSKFADYGDLSGLSGEKIKEGARVEVNPEKKNPTDFALWKFSPEDSSRWQEWSSPWGKGFPGWHLECSAMCMSELGPTVDLHVGGEDLKMIHHQNEIAQSEAATGKKFVNYWIHGAFLLVDSGKMSKSLGNAFTLYDLEERGYSPMDLRYFYFGAHYRSQLNFTWEALSASRSALEKLQGILGGYSETSGKISPEHVFKFEEALLEDLNMPKVLAVVWDLVRGDLPEGDKVTTLVLFDKVLGLGLGDHVAYEIPQEIMDLAKTREQYRKSGIWDKADAVRREIEEKGYVVEDEIDGFKVKLALS